MSGWTPGPWAIDWFVCEADADDVRHAAKEGKTLSIGAELWRAAKSIGPISIEHNHWAGDYLTVEKDDARLIAEAPAMAEALQRWANAMGNMHEFDKWLSDIRAILARINGDAP